jgi:transposase
MDGFGGYKTAAVDQPEATTVMDPFHVVALAGTKLDVCRQRVQQQACGHRGRAGDPLYRVRRTLRTRFPLLSSRQKARLESCFRRRQPPRRPRHVERLSVSSPPTHTPTPAAPRP